MRYINRRFTYLLTYLLSGADVITELIIQKLSAVFATKNLLELDGDECGNSNFMNFKIDSFKIRKNS